MAVADRHGLPIAIGIESGQRNEQKLVVGALRQRFLKELPLRLIGDKAYDSDPLDAELADIGVEMIAPHHPRRRRKTQDGRPLRRYRRRWLVGVSGEGHIVQSVEVRSRSRDSGLVAWEAPWRESKTVKPSDHVLKLEYSNVPGCNVQ